MKSSTKIIIFFICISLIAFKWWHFVQKATSPQPIPKLDLVEQVKEENQKLINKRAEEEQQREAQKQKEQQEREEQQRQREAQKKPISQVELNNLIDTLIALEDENNLNQFECTSNELIKNSLVRYINRHKKYNTTINEEQKKIDDLNNKIKDITDKKRPLKSQYDKSTPEFERLQLKDDNDTLTKTEKNRYNKLFNERTQLEIDISKLQHEYEGLKDIQQRTEDLKQYFEYKRDQYISLNKNALIDDLKKYYRLQEEEPTKPMSELDAYEKETAEVETSIPQEYKVKINNAVETLTKVEDINQLDQYQDVFCMNVTRIKDVVKERINAINACKTEAEKDEARKAYKIILKNELTIECDEEKPWQPSK